MKIMIGDECSLLAAETSSNSNNKCHAEPTSSNNVTLLCADLVGSLSEDSVLQIMSDPKDGVVTSAVTLRDPSTALGALNLLLIDSKKKPEENVPDIDLSFLSEGIVSSDDGNNRHLNDNVVRELTQSLSLNFLGSHVECSQEQEAAEIESTPGVGAEEGVLSDTVMIDVSQPIQLSQNSLIVVNGQKCVLQHDPRTGQVVAYPVRRPTPHRRRGRPRKTSVEQVFLPPEKNPAQENENLSEEDREKGLLEIVNDDGSLVRRSSRKRKKAKTLKDYETGNLQQELGSDVDDLKETEVEQHLYRRRRPKGPGRPRKYNTPFENVSENSAIHKESGDVRRPRGRPRKLEAAESGGEASQAFLVQTADGQSLMLQVPLSSIPPGTTLQQMAHEIAHRINIGLQASPSSAEKTVSGIEEPPALQDHSIGSTTHFSQQQQQPHFTIGEEEICESQEITLECDQSLSDTTSGATNLVEEEESNLNVVPESLEDQFCLDVSSTTTTGNSVDATTSLLCPFNEHLIDHSFYATTKPLSPKTAVPLETTDAQKDPLFPGNEEVESTIVVVDPVFDTKTHSSDPFSVLTSDESKNGNNAVLTQEELPVKGSEVLTVLLQEQSLTAVPETSSPVLLPAEVSPDPKKCKICAVPYITEEEIVEHFKAKHPKCICLECNYMNEHPYGIKRHSYRHANEESVCHICHKKYKDSYILKMHVKMVHLPPEVLFRCDVCSKEFTRKAHLKRHSRIHAPLRQYSCPLCDYHGCERSDVTKHLLIHEEPKFKCEFCGKAFRHLKNKELHIKRHSGQRDYKCAACNFYGYTYTDIRKHIERRHSAICPNCKQIFSDPQLCKEHRKLGLCQSSILKTEECPPPPPTIDDKKEIVLFGDSGLSLDI